VIWRALFAYLHLLAAGLTAALVIGQYWMLKRPVDRVQASLLGTLGLGQLLAGIAVIATGTALASSFGMGSGYYLGHPLFLLKMGIFAVLALVSFLPLRQYVRWTREARRRPAFLPLSREVERVRAALSLMIGLLALLPLPAVLVARGFGS
jgi:putative membrane protein